MVDHFDQNGGQNSNIPICNKSFKRVEQFTYLETTLTNKNSNQEEMKSRFKTKNTCYHSAQNLLSSSFLPKNVKINM